jgi:hypothetical protein
LDMYLAFSIISKVLQVGTVDCRRELYMGDTIQTPWQIL